jgi:hypothetical protein
MLLMLSRALRGATDIFAAALMFIRHALRAARRPRHARRFDGDARLQPFLPPAALCPFFPPVAAAAATMTPPRY